MDVVYIDEWFLLNALADYLLLLSGARLRGIVLRRGRFAAAAALGALYAVLTLFPRGAWLSMGAVKLAVSGLMALLAYGGGPGFLRSWGVFLALSAAYGGAVLAAALLSGGRVGRVLTLAVSRRTLCLSFALFYALLRLFLDRAEQRRQQGLAAVTVSLGERRSAFTALRDTGNTLCDPISARPILIAEARVLRELFPPALPLWPPEEDSVAFLRALSPWPELQRRFRLVPYRSVGRSGALLLCFQPDAVTVDGAAQDCLVGVSPTRFSRKDDYEAIV